MIDHVKLFATDPAASRAFYEQALGPIGYRVMLEPAPGVVGMGVTMPNLWIAPAESAPTLCHLAFRVDAEFEVDAFHAAALAAGGTDNGRPGLRPHYHQNYYGAFVLDPDGNNVEAVYHGAMQPETTG
jgi:catechol 2,3-dioxygenase-like lactoylglutathione lyase family enzyme